VYDAFAAKLEELAEKTEARDVKHGCKHLRRIIEKAHRSYGKQFNKMLDLVRIAGSFVRVWIQLDLRQLHRPPPLPLPPTLPPPPPPTLPSLCALSPPLSLAHHSPLFPMTLSPIPTSLPSPGARQASL
jgi:hypothetical protein